MKSNTPSPEHVDHLTTVAKDKGFLGREFLTWLWYTAETTNQRQKVLNRDGTKDLEFDLWIDDRMILEAAALTAQVAQQNTLKGGDPSHSREASAALAGGKSVRELKIGVNVKGVGEFSAVLGCDDLSPRSLKLPVPDADGKSAPSDELPLATRLRHMDTFLAVLDGLFARYLAVRTADDWETSVLADVRGWVRKRQKSDETGTLH